jgi:hypothetical protein
MEDEMPDRDFLDEVVDERTARNPDFPAMVESFHDRRVARQLTDDPEFSDFAPLREDDDVVPVTRVRPID